MMALGLGRHSLMCYHRTMRRLILAALGLLLVGAGGRRRPIRWPRRGGSTTPASTRRPSAPRAKRWRSTAWPTPRASCSAAIQLERFRQTADPADLTAARESLRSVDPAPLEYRERARADDRPGRGRSTSTIASAPPPSCSSRRSIGRRCSARRARARARLVGDRARSSRAVATDRGPPADLRPRSSSGCATSSRSTRARRQRATGWRPPPRRAAISSERGRPRWPAGSAPASRRIAAPRCAPTSIGS